MAVHYCRWLPGSLRYPHLLQSIFVISEDLNRKMASLLHSRSYKSKLTPPHHHPTQLQPKPKPKPESSGREQQPIPPLLHRTPSLKNFFNPHPNPSPSRLPVCNNLPSPKSPHSSRNTPCQPPNEGNLPCQKEVFTPAQEEYCISPNSHPFKPPAHLLLKSSRF